MWFGRFPCGEEPHPLCEISYFTSAAPVKFSLFILGHLCKHIHIHVLRLTLCSFK
uniref:Uncharacterized protein n=1 Tax=Anguilla anguilla TaxID=7936 RepID=A0A0E9UU20_ANGAN